MPELIHLSGFIATLALKSENPTVFSLFSAKMANFANYI